MTTSPRKIIALAAAGFVAFFASSVATSQTGNDSGLLKQALAALANGDCPSETLSPMTIGGCEQAMPGLSQKLTALGDIVGLKYLGNQQTPQGLTEVYLVSFANGKATWMINTGPDGKVLVLWSPS